MGEGAGDTIHLAKRTLRVIGKRDDDADQPPVLIVEDGGLMVAISWAAGATLLVLAIRHPERDCRIAAVNPCRLGVLATEFAEGT